jgi:homoserine O-acetyltransferase/O-succinyltransferase
MRRTRALFLILFCVAHAQSPTTLQPKEGDFVLHDFHFRSGETLPELRLHYTTLGTPVRDAHGRVQNAVMILHGTTRSGKVFLNPAYMTLYASGQPLDLSRWYVILPDSIGTPASAMVGTSGNKDERFLVVTPSARRLPERISVKA